MHKLIVMNTKGDEPLEWSPDDKDSIKKARNRFNRLKKQGYRFYQAVVTKGSVVDKFDPSLGLIIAAPPMAGGPVASAR